MARVSIQRTPRQRAMDDAVKAFDDVPYQAFEDFHLKAGDRIGFEKDGVIFITAIKTIDQNEETGEVRITCA